MIDRFLYAFFESIDKAFAWIDKLFQKKPKKKKKKLKKVITEEQWIKRMVGKKNGK